MNGASRWGGFPAWNKIKATALSTTILCALGTQASAMDLKKALEITLHTNPEIAESAANRRAIDFEYEQAKRLSNPSIIVEGRAGPEWVDSRTTRLLGNDEDVLWGRQASITMQQSLYDFGRNESERDRQASRVDAAAHRVWERSELVSLDVVQSYFDILRLREVLDFADQNVSFHENKVSEMTRGATGGRLSEADAQQSRERLSASIVSRNETEEAMEIAESNFIRIVGRGIGRAKMPPSISASLPTSLADALRQARTSNPTLHIARGDLSTARAEYRKAKADGKPTLGLEIAGRAGEDIGGFRDTTNDVRAQLVFRHEFRGGIKSSAVQEHINWVDEKRQRLLRLERSVDGLVREAWATRQKTSQRRAELQKQVDEGTRVLDSYQREFDANRRTLLDILDAQSGLFQAKTALTTAQHADVYAQYRLLASTGRLLEVMDLSPRREANANVRAIEGTEDNPEADADPRRYPKHFDKSMGGASAWSPSVATIDKITDEELASLEIIPVQKQWASKPGDAPKPARTVEVTKQASVKVAAAKPVLAAPKAPVVVAEAKPVIAKPAPSVEKAVVETAKVESETPKIVVADTYKPKVYGDYSPSQTVMAAPVVTVTEPVVAAVTAPAVEQPAVQASVEITAAPSTDLAPPIVKNTIDVREEPIMGRTGPLALEAVLSSPVVEAPIVEYADNVASDDDALPIGVPIQKVSTAEFAQIKTRDNAKIYWSMGAVLHDNVLYLMEK